MSDRTTQMTPGAGPEAEQWFVDHGLPWFVPHRREAAHRALHSRRTLVGLALTVVVAIAVGVLLAGLAEQAALAPATLVTLVVVAAAAYAGGELGGWPIARWAVRKTLRSLPMLFPMITRALPLLLVFVTFLFINAEVWQVSATLDGGVLWLTVLLFAGLAVVFLVVRLPEELDAVDDQVPADAIVRTCRGTPLAPYAETLAADLRRRGQVLTDDTRVWGMEKANLVLVLVIAQAVQVLLLSVAVFAFFVVFGGIVMTHGVQESWVGSAVHALPFAENLSVELLQVSTFLAAFSGLYFTVYAVTDESYRDQFFTGITSELERAVGVRAVYLAARRG